MVNTKDCAACITGKVVDYLRSLIVAGKLVAL